MLRRVARGLRLLLFTLGVALLVWFPVSFYYQISLLAPWPFGGAQLWSLEGSLKLFVFKADEAVPGYAASAGRQYFDSVLADQFWVTVEWRDIYHVHVPLWMVALLCLAWPVMSFVMRKRRRRGFEVEARTSNIEPPTSNFEVRET